MRMNCPFAMASFVLGIVDLARRKSDRKRGHHQRHNGLLPERAQDLEGHDREHVCFGFNSFGITG